MEDLQSIHWFFGILGAIFIGLGKGGLPGMGNITVAIYAIILPDPKLSVGVLLPILCASDIVAVSIYRKHAKFKDVLQLLPWAFIGIVLGYYFFQRLEPEQVRVFMGAILLGLTCIHFIRLKWFDSEDRPSDSLSNKLFFRAGLGTVGGFATMIANAAGPVAAFYFISMRLPKVIFVGTTAWFFLVINWIKIPFMINLGIINTNWFPFSLIMMIPAVVATLVAKRILKYIPQKLFSQLIWFFIVLAAIKLLTP